MLLYNSNIGYSQPGMSYSGSLTISAPGFNSLISLQDIRIYLSQNLDNSNESQSSFITINFFSSGNITFETTSAPNGAGLVSSSSVASNYSGIIESSNTNTGEGLLSTSSVQTNYSGLVSISNI